MKKLSEFLEGVNVGEVTALDVTGEPGDRKLTISSRKLNPEAPRAPDRAESPARAHVLHSAESLADYIRRYGSSKSVVLADVGGEAIYATLDETARGGFERVVMRPAIHPLWAPWAAKAGLTTKIEDFAEFVAQHRRSVVAPPGRELVITLSQVKATVKVEIHKGRGKNSINGVVVTTDIKGGGQQTETVELPDSITLLVPLYVGTEPQQIELDLTLKANAQGEVGVAITAGTVAEARLQAFARMVETVKAGCAGVEGGAGAVFGYGKPETKDWDYLGDQE